MGLTGIFFSIHFSFIVTRLLNSSEIQSNLDHDQRQCTDLMGKGEMSLFKSLITQYL